MKRTIALIFSGAIVAIILANWFGVIGKILGFNSMTVVGLIPGAFIAIVSIRSGYRLPHRRESQLIHSQGGSVYNAGRATVAFGTSAISLLVSLVLIMLVQQGQIDWLYLEHSGVWIFVISLIVAVVFFYLREQFLGATIVLSTGLAFSLAVAIIAMMSR